MVSSLSKRSAKQLSEVVQLINSEKVGTSKMQSASAQFSATPIIKKTFLKKPGGSGHHLESRKSNLNILARETCTTQIELKKKLGQIFKQ